MRAPAPRPAPVYAIADLELLGASRVVDAVSEMASAGIGTIQIRAKGFDDDRIARLCDRLFERLAGLPVSLWIDDRADAACLWPFDGVHLGQRDLAPKAVRPWLPEGRAIGWSTHDQRQIACGASDACVDWLAIGPVFPTRSKRDPDPVVGLAGVSMARQATGKPVVAIGGIDEGNVASVLAAGADSAAVLSAICRGDVAANARRLLRAAGVGR